MKSLRAFLAWTLSHLRRSRASRFVLLLLLLGAAAVIAVLVTPVQEDLRVLLYVSGGLGLLAVAVLYLAYRTVGFARRLTTELAALRESLAETADDFQRMDRLRAVDRAQSASEARNVADGIEARLNAGLQALNQRFTQIDNLREELRQLKDALGETHALAARTAVQGDTLDIRLSAATSSIDRLHGLWKSDADHRQNQAAAISEQLARDSAALQVLTSGQARMTAAVEDSQRRYNEVEKRVDRLAQLLDTLAVDHGASAGKLNELSDAQAGVAALAQNLSSGQAADRAAVARLQREIVVLAEVQTSASERARILGDQSAEAIRALQELTSRQGQFERRLADFVSDTGTTLQQLGISDRNLRDSLETVTTEMRRRHEEVAGKLREMEGAGEKHAAEMAVRLSTIDRRHEALGEELTAEKAEGRRRHEEAAAELKQLRIMSQQTAETTRALEQRQATLGEKLGAVMADIATGAARIDEVGQKLAAASVEISRAASVTAELDARQENLAGIIDVTRQELAKAVSAAADGEARLVAAGRQAGETAAALKDLAESTTARFLDMQHRFETVAARAETAVAADKQTASAVSEMIQQIAGLQAGVAAAAAAHGDLEAQLKALSARLEHTAGLTAQTAARQVETMGGISAASERLEAVSRLANDLGDLLSTLQASMETVRQDQIASVSALTDRVDGVIADLDDARRAFQQSTSDILVRLGDLDSRVERGVGGDRIAAIEADIAQIVRLVDEAEAAFADEISRLAATTSKLSDDLALLGKQAVEGSAGLETRLNALQKTLSDSINVGMEGRLSSVEKDVAQVSRLLNDWEVATADELAQLSATVLQLRDDLQKADNRDASAPGEADGMIEPLRLQLARAASQLEMAVRDTERALGDLGRHAHSPTPTPRAGKAGAMKKRARSKGHAKSPSRSAPPRARKGR